MINRCREACVWARAREILPLLRDHRRRCRLETRARFMAMALLSQGETEQELARQVLRFIDDLMRDNRHLDERVIMIKARYLGARLRRAR